MSDVKVEFREINSFKEENFDPKYTELNPNSTIPMITEGQTKIIGDGQSLYYYLVNRLPEVK